MKKITMQAPEGTCSAEVHGHHYDLDDDGRIEVTNEDHLATLKRHGFTEVTDEDDGEEDEAPVATEKKKKKKNRK